MYIRLNKKIYFSDIKNTFKSIQSNFNDISLQSMKLIADDLNENVNKQLYYTHLSMNFETDEYGTNNSYNSRNNSYNQDIEKDNLQKELSEIEETTHKLNKLTTEIKKDLINHEKEICLIYLK
jgi:hypothetical protein